MSHITSRHWLCYNFPKQVLHVSPWHTLHHAEKGSQTHAWNQTMGYHLLQIKVGHHSSIFLLLTPTIFWWAPPFSWDQLIGACCISGCRMCQWPPQSPDYHWLSDAFMLCGGAASYQCKTQSITATTSTKAEFLAAVTLAQHTKHLSAIIQQLGFFLPLVPLFSTATMSQPSTWSLPASLLSAPATLTFSTLQSRTGKMLVTSSCSSSMASSTHLMTLLMLYKETCLWWNSSV